MTSPPAAAERPGPLAYLFPAWFAIPMGLCGLSLAWHRAVPLMGEPAQAVAMALAALGALVFVLLLVATVWRGLHHASAWADDRRHPVRHTMVATLPVSALLVATAGQACGVPAAWVAPLWAAATLGLLFVTWWVVSRWFRGKQPGGLQWATVTPALFIPVVGQVLVPLAGVPLGHGDWSAAQFGVGLMFWPVVTVLLMVRLAQQGMWPERLLPTTVIFVAPPAVIGSACLQFGAPVTLVWALWGMGLFSLLWVASLGRRIGGLPFGLAHWGMSFPLAAFTALTLRLLPSGPLAPLGVALLAVVSLLVAALVLATVRGLRDGSLLAPEPVAVITPVGQPTAG